MIFRMWDFSFGTYTVWVSKTQTWKFFGHDFQNVGSSVPRDLEFALRVSKTQKDLGNFRIWFSEHGFQVLGSQLWGLDFHTRGFQDRNLKTFKTWFSGCGISILGPGFHTGGFTWSKTWNFFGKWFSGHGWEPCNFTVSEGHEHPLVRIMVSIYLSLNLLHFNYAPFQIRFVWLLIFSWVTCISMIYECCPNIFHKQIALWIIIELNGNTLGQQKNHAPLPSATPHPNFEK